MWCFASRPNNHIITIYAFAKSKAYGNFTGILNAIYNNIFISSHRGALPNLPLKRISVFFLFSFAEAIIQYSRLTVKRKRWQHIFLLTDDWRPAMIKGSFVTHLTVIMTVFAFPILPAFAACVLYVCGASAAHILQGQEATDAMNKIYTFHCFCMVGRSKAPTVCRLCAWCIFIFGCASGSRTSESVDKTSRIFCHIKIINYPQNVSMNSLPSFLFTYSHSQNTSAGELLFQLSHYSYCVPASAQIKCTTWTIS